MSEHKMRTHETGGAIKKYFTEQTVWNRENIAQFPSRFTIKDKTHTVRSITVKLLSFTSGGSDLKEFAT
jgi:hypothetical protein